MVRSKEELLQCANAWVAQAKSDIRNQIVNFIQMSGVSEEQLADILGISQRELTSLIETNNEVSLSTFAKLLIATDNVLEIKPLSESPLANAPRGTVPTPPTRPVSQQPRDSRGRFAAPHRPTPYRGGTRPMPTPPMGGMPIPTDRDGRPLPPPPGFPMPPMGDGNAPQRFGGMPGMAQRMQRVAQPEVGGNRPIDDLASKTRPDLVQMIRDNFWDGEIDAASATRGELIDFLMAKRGIGLGARVPQTPIEPRQNRYTVNPTPQPAPQPIEEPQVAETAPIEEHEDASLAAFQQMLDNAVAQNPHLRDVIAQYQN